MACLFMLVLGDIFVVPDTAMATYADPMDNRVDSLLSLMTLEEKVGQMTNIGLMAVCKGDFWEGRDTIEIDSAKLRRLLLDHHVGSVQNMGKYPPAPAEWRQLIGAVQQVALQESRLRIPVLYGIDGVHGANYTAGSVLFPQQIATAATWDPAFAETAARVTAYEIRAAGIPWNYSPVLDVCKQPLWGRIFETFGEDTYLTQQMGAAMVRGMQGDDVADPHHVAACLKHFAGYGMAYNGKDRSPVYLPERWLRQYIFPPFQAAIDAGALTVMINSGSVNGIPSHIDYHLITEVLKGEMNFQGFTISDWSDIMNLVEAHQVAADEREAVKLSVLAGLDMCMEPYDESFAVHLVQLVKDGEVPMSRIDDAVRRILKVKFQLGLFENPLPPPSLYPAVGSAASVAESYQAALACLTLLKNEAAVLPLPKKANVLVTGAAANSLNYLNGGWSRTWSGRETAYNDEEKQTIFEAIQAKLGSEQVSFVPGTTYTEEVDIAAAVTAAQAADYLVVCLGEQPATEKPSDIDDLSMPQAQLDLVRALAQTGKPIILVLVEGRPRLIREIEPLANGILLAYVPGQEGGRAIAEVLFGDTNPSGKLPYTYPRYSGSIWAYDHLRSDERDQNFGYDGFNPQYEFGFGLSYTTFAYADLRFLPDTVVTGEEVLEVRVTVTNTGKRAGQEVVQLYTSDLVASISPAVKQLRRFAKIALAPGASQEVRFSLAAKDLAFVNQHNQWVTEPGAFTVTIGPLKKTFVWQP